jgi:hypothetical protein
MRAPVQTRGVAIAITKCLLMANAGLRGALWAQRKLNRLTVTQKWTLVRLRASALENDPRPTVGVLETPTHRIIKR